MYVLRPSQSIGLKRILGTTIMRVTIMVSKIHEENNDEWHNAAKSL